MRFPNKMYTQNAVYASSVQEQKPTKISFQPIKTSKPLTILLLAVLALASSILTCTQTPGRQLGERIEFGKGYRLDEEGIMVVHLRGTESEMREQYEALLANEIASYQAAARKHRVLSRFVGECTNIACFAEASVDGKLWHGRNFDFPGHGVIDRYRTVFVMEPDGKIPFVAIGWAGAYPEGVHTAMNAKGLSLGYMHSPAPGETIMDAPLLWMLFRRIMEEASTIEEALGILEKEPRKGSANLLLADGKVPDAVVVELTSSTMAVRKADHGIIYSTNHFVSPELSYAQNRDPDTHARFKRLGQLAGMHRGKFDLHRVVATLRDRYDVHLSRDCLGGDIIGTPANLLSVVFCPGDLTFWVAEGSAPAAYNRFVGFSLRDEFQGTQSECTVKSVPQDSIVATESWDEVKAFQSGYLAYLQGDDSTAVVEFEKAMELGPCAGYGYHLGVALITIGRYAEAAEAFQRALACDSLSSFCAPIYYRLGRIYEAIGMEKEMRAALEQVLSLDTGDEYIRNYARRALESLSR